MDVYVIRKKKGRLYKSEDIVPLLLADSGRKAVFSHDLSGAPLLDKGYVSVSDTKGYWAAAFSDSPVGLDMEERARTVKPGLASKLHRKEQDYLSALQPDSREWKEEFLGIWVRKEAYMKLCGTGLSLGLSKFSVVDKDLGIAAAAAAKGRPEGRFTEVALSPALISYVCVEAEAPAEEVNVVRYSYDGRPPMEIIPAALTLVYERNYSSAELAKKLEAKGFGEEEIKEAVAEISRRGYIDDESYAVRLAEKLSAQGKGLLRIESELRKKGVDEKTLETALERLKEDSYPTEYEKALILAEKALPEGPERPDEKALARLARKLSSAGYSSSVIYRVLDRYRS